MNHRLAGIIAILEDNASRIDAMRESLTAIIPTTPRVFISENAGEMIDWLKTNLAEATLISLDHDLPLKSRERPIDCGDGRMVADYLAALPPTCPVIVHSSNDLCATGMFHALQYAGWPVWRVVPYDGEDWISREWVAQIRSLIRDGWLNW